MYIIKDFKHERARSHFANMRVFVAVNNFFSTHLIANEVKNCACLAEIIIWSASG